MADVEQVRAKRSNSPFRAKGLAAELKEIIRRKVAEARREKAMYYRGRLFPLTCAWYDGYTEALVELKESICAQERKQARARNADLSGPSDGSAPRTG